MLDLKDTWLPDQQSTLNKVRCKTYYKAYLHSHLKSLYLSFPYYKLHCLCQVHFLLKMRKCDLIKLMFGKMYIKFNHHLQSFLKNNLRNHLHVTMIIFKIDLRFLDLQWWCYVFECTTGNSHVLRIFWSSLHFLRQSSSNKTGTCAQSSPKQQKSHLQ